MKWDNENKVPVEGTYTPIGISGEIVLKQLKGEYLGSDVQWEQDVRTHLSAFSIEGLSLDEFMSQHKYRNIEVRLPLMEELLHLTACFKTKAVADHLSDIVDSVTLMSRIFDGVTGDERADLLCRLYFCEKEEDFWDIFLEGVGNPMDWARSYAGERVSGHTTKTVSDERFKRFIKYMELKGISLKTRFDELYV